MGRERRSVRRLAALAIAALFLALAPAAAQAQSQGDKEKAKAHYERGEAFRRAGAHDKAAEEFQAAYKLFPRPALLFNIALAYQEGGDRARAVEYFDRFLKTNPQGDLANEALARKTALDRDLAAERDAEKARRAAAEAEARKRAEAEKQKQDAAARHEEGRRHATTGAHDDAIASFRAAYAIHPDPEILFDLGESLRASGDAKQALTTFNRYRVEAPTGPRAGDAIERIAALEREIAAAAGGPGGGTSTPAFVAGGQVEQRAEPASKKSRVVWLSLAAAAIGTGVLLDLGPGSSRNGELEGKDFAPVALYAVGGVLGLYGVF